MSSSLFSGFSLGLVLSLNKSSFPKLLAAELRFQLSFLTFESLNKSKLETISEKSFQKVKKFLEI